MNSGALLPVDHRLLAALAAHDGPQGIHPSTARLARDVGVSRRYVFQRLAKLDDLGLIERVPVIESEDDPEWLRRGRAPLHEGRRTSTSYRLRRSGSSWEPYELGALAHQPPEAANGAAQTPMNSAGEVRRPVHSKTETSKKQGECRYQGTAEPVEISVDPPEAAMLDHDPSPAEVLATLTAAFGPVQVERWPEGHKRSPPTYRTARGRVTRLVDLEHDSLDDLRLAVDQLNRDTCTSEGDRCDLKQRYRCHRHTGRKEAA